MKPAEQVEALRPPKPFSPSLAHLEMSAGDGHQSARAGAGDWTRRKEPVDALQLQAEPGESCGIEESDDDAREAFAYLGLFYDSALMCLDEQHQAEQIAIDSFRDFTEIEDPPDLSTTIVTSLLRATFRAVDGWETIENGIRRGLFAADLSTLRGHEEAMAEYIAGAAEEGLGAATDVSDAEDSQAAAGHAYRTASQASDAAYGSLGRWSEAGRALLRERRTAQRLLTAADRHPPLRCQLTELIRSALGPIPDPEAMHEHLADAAIAYELRLYRRRFGSGSGTRLVIRMGSSPRTTRVYISGGGWRAAVGTRIRELRPELQSDNALASYLGLPTEVIVNTESPHNPEGFSRPGGPYQ